MTMLALLLLLMPLLAVVRSQPVSAAGVVSQCTEAALRNALEGGGLVTFSCSGVIPIASQIVVAADTVIDGGGQVTLDGGGVTRLLRVNGGVSLTVRDLTLTGGFSTGFDGGGAILNFGTLTVVDSTLSGNLADWGGAIDNYGSLTLTASTLANNQSVNSGGALYINRGATATIVASTLANNTAGRAGGAILNDPGTTATIVASTLANNTASIDGGAIYNFRGTFDAGVAQLTANLLSGNAPRNCFGGIVSNGYNVASDSTCNLTATGDAQNVNPLLGNLANNGGPTPTMLPQPGSPALDRVPNAVCTTLSAATDGHDQRGAPRPEAAGLPCDSGSVELQVNSYFCVGDRSGALRYFVTPNGCVRGEFRLLPTGEGVYAFCVGDRSGSMRYLMSAGANCQRGETKLLLPQPDPITICVGELSRSVRYVAEAGQCNPRGELPYVIVNPAV